jgi:hypothetical protein
VEHRLGVDETDEGLAVGFELGRGGGSHGVESICLYAQHLPWGCTIAGLTTPEEQSAYAEWLLQKGHPERRRELLFDASQVPWSDLTAGDVPAVLRMLGEPPPNPLSDPQDVPGPRLRWWLLPLVALPIYAIATTAPWADPRATAATGVWLVFAVWAVLSAIAAVRRNGAARRAYAIAAAVSALAAAGFILVGRL